jgi:hypothetical protein
MKDKLLMHLLSPYVRQDGSYYLNEDVMTIIAAYKSPIIREQIAQEIEAIPVEASTTNAVGMQLLAAGIARGK